MSRSPEEEPVQLREMAEMVRAFQEEERMCAGSWTVPRKGQKTQVPTRPRQEMQVHEWEVYVVASCA